MVLKKKVLKITKTINFEHELFNQLVQQAERNEVTIHAVLNEILRDYFEIDEEEEEG